MKYYKADNRRKFFEEKIVEQLGRCKLCGRKERLVIDHCHKSGMMRGLLCYKHNSALGLFEDDINLLKCAISYLEEHATGFTYTNVKQEIDKKQVEFELLSALLNDSSFLSDRARSREFAKRMNCSIAAAQSKVHRFKYRIKRQGA